MWWSNDQEAYKRWFGNLNVESQTFISKEINVEFYIDKLSLDLVN